MRRLRLSGFSALSYFNPRTRVGCDVRKTSQGFSAFKFQSTHPCRVRQVRSSPIRLTSYFNPRIRVGCDLTDKYNRMKILNFNPRTRVGCDDIRDLKRVIMKEFQSTHPCRVRRSWIYYYWANSDFNPRTRVGCDLSIPDYIFINLDFNPRTRVGCDRHLRFNYHNIAISIHAPV